MIYLLDTNTCVYIMKQKPAQVLNKFLSLNPFDVGISSITLAELEYGVYKSQRRFQNSLALEQFITPLVIVPYDQKATKVYAEVRTELEQQGKVIGAMDLLIASHAISLGVILVTNNVREFARIPNLIWENWV